MSCSSCAPTCSTPWPAKRFGETPATVATATYERCSRREPSFWTEFSLRAEAYDTAVARQEPGAKPDMVVMAIFQELLGNPDPDTLLLGLRAWKQFVGPTQELRKYLRSLRIEHG